MALRAAAELDETKTATRNARLELALVKLASGQIRFTRKLVRESGLLRH